VPPPPLLLHNHETDKVKRVGPGLLSKTASIAILAQKLYHSDQNNAKVEIALSFTLQWQGHRGAREERGAWAKQLWPLDHDYLSPAAWSKQARDFPEDLG